MILFQLKFIQKTIIKVFFLVHYFNYATLLPFSHASLIPSPSKINYWSSFAWLFKYRIITYMPTFICYQDISLGHLFAKASLAVKFVKSSKQSTLLLIPSFLHKKLKTLHILLIKILSYVLIKHWLEHWWTATSIYATSHNTVIINKHFLRLHLKKSMCSTN